jgi:hypothetical protein
MRNPQTLFVVGAGASSEVDMPTGRQLIDIIAKKLDYQLVNGSRRQGFGDEDILDIFQQNTQTREGIESHFQAAWRVRDGIIYSKSIDAFMDIHEDDEKVQLCGKLAIVKSILEAEQASYLYIEKEGGEFRVLEKLKSTWFFDFARNINDGVRRTEISRIFEKVSFIIFNYDRCFEHFMFNAVRRLYSIDADTAASIMKTLRIVHPYGTIADLLWEDKKGMPFGFPANRTAMQLMASRIKTYTEQIEQSETLEEMRDVISDAHTIVFLGFSYHPANMKLIGLEHANQVEQIFGTAKGVSESDTAFILREIEASVPKTKGRKTVPVAIRDLTCADLLGEYSRELFIPGATRH